MVVKCWRGNTRSALWCRQHQLLLEAGMPARSGLGRNRAPVHGDGLGTWRTRLSRTGSSLGGVAMSLAGRRAHPRYPGVEKAPTCRRQPNTHRFNPSCACVQAIDVSVIQCGGLNLTFSLVCTPYLLPTRLPMKQRRASGSHGYRRQRKLAESVGANSTLSASSWVMMTSASLIGAVTKCSDV